MIRLRHIQGRLQFVLLDSHGDALPIEGSIRAWRTSRFPRYWREVVRGAS